MADNVTAADVNARVDRMAKVFIKLQDTVIRISDVYKRQNEHLEPEAEALKARMDELYRSIQASPAIRRQADIELAELKDKLLPPKDRLDDLEAEAMLDINYDLNQNGKPTYTNDKTRSAASRLALAANDEYQTRLDEHRTLDLNRVRLQAQVDEIRHVDQNNRIIYGGCIARLADLTKRRK